MLSFTISITWSAFLSFPLTFKYLCLKTSRILFLSLKLLIWFISLSVAFSTKTYNCRLSSSIFLLSFFHWAISHFCDVILLSYFQFTLLIRCFDYLHFIAAYHLDYSFSCPSQETLFYSILENSSFFLRRKSAFISCYLCILVRCSFLTQDLA